MPTFLFISGYFAKNLDKPYLEKLQKLLPYVIFLRFSHFITISLVKKMQFN